MNLSKAAEDYISMRQQLGFKLRNIKYVLRNFVAYARRKKVSYITTQLALEFSTQNHNSSPNQWAVNLGIIRSFARHLQSIDPRTEVPPAYLLPYRYQRPAPYIYSNSDINNILDALKRLPSATLFTRNMNYTLFGLLAVTGMRISEALSLCRESVDLKHGLITIRESKCKKSRQIPIHPSVQKILKKYLLYRDKYLGKKSSPFFFVDNKGGKLKAASFRRDFTQARDSIGLNKGKERGPSLMNLRHTFATKTLITCYKKKMDVDIIIPALSTYLGHENPINTYWYLTATHELLNLINDRLENLFGGDL